MIDIGGGWPRQREPESRAPALNPHPIENYASAAASALAEGLAAGNRPLPELWLEPGRYIVGNAVLMLATVGAIKRDADRVWVHVDACTNHLMRIDTSASWHHILPASRMDAPPTEIVDIVGSTCIPSVLGTDRSMPALQAGDIVAILDTGMYADAISNQFNGVPRPATVLIGNGDVAVIKRRETIDDLFSRDVIPPRLA
jgi:diaminopimelate decarboxylase